MGIICLVTAMLLSPSALAQVHGCTLEGAEDLTGESQVSFQWSLPHNRCILIKPGTTVTWSGNFNSHPLAGGVSDTKDESSPISSPGDDIGSVTFNNEGDFPYFCRIHIGSMTGVIYVRAPAPSEFSKDSPANGEANQPTSPSLSWGSSSAAIRYEYCIDTSLNGTCDEVWANVGANTNANPSGLEQGTTYQWQVRAINDAATTEANAGAWWQFTTVVDPPGAFSKVDPPNDAVDQATSSNLTWTAGTGADSYEYCIDTNDNNSCDGIWIDAGAVTSVNPKPLNVLTTYYWQVMATNLGGTVLADSGTWWSFSTSEFAEIVFSDSFEEQ